MFCLRWFGFGVPVPIHNIWTTAQANFVCLHWIVPGNRLAVCTYASICLSISAYLKSGRAQAHERIRGGTHTLQSTQTKIGGRVLFQASAVIIPVNVAYYMYRKHYYKVIRWWRREGKRRLHVTVPSRKFVEWTHRKITGNFIRGAYHVHFSPAHSPSY